MPFVLPLFLKLSRHALERRDAIPLLVAHALRPAAADAALAFHSFAFKCDELGFARELLRRKSHLWLFRSNQRAFCGDFIVVDVSSPAVDRRRAFVIDLKRGAALRLGGGGAGVQLRNAERVVRAVAAQTSALGAEASYELVTGDGLRILDFFGVSAPPTVSAA